MRRMILVAAAIAAACAPQEKARTDGFPVRPAPGGVVVATFTGEMDAATGILRVTTEPTVEALANGFPFLQIEDPGGVRVANDPAGSLWSGAPGHCTNPGALSSGRLVQVTTVSDAYKTAATYLTGVYAQITEISDPASSSCNSVEKPSWIQVDPGFGLWEFPYALAQGNYVSSTPWAFAWNAGTGFTFRGIVLAASHLEYLTPDAGWMPRADLASAASRRDAVLSFDPMGSVLYAAPAGLGLFSTWNSSFQADQGMALVAPPSSMAPVANGSLWFTTVASSEATPTAYAGCTSMYSFPGGAALTLGYPDRAVRGIAVDPSAFGMRGWFIESGGPTVQVVGANCDPFEGMSISEADRFVPTSDGTNSMTPNFVVARGTGTFGVSELYVSGPTGISVYLYDPVAVPTVDWLASVSGPCTSPMNMTIGGMPEFLYVSDAADGKICRTTLDGAATGPLELYAEAPAGFHGGPLAVDSLSRVWMLMHDAGTDLARAVGLVVPGVGGATGTVIPYPLTSNDSPPAWTTGLVVDVTGSTGAQYVLSAAVTGAGTGLGLRRIAEPSLLSSLTFDPPSIGAGQGTTGTVALASPAPPGGAVVELWTLDGVTMPASVTVPAGQSSVSFAVTTTGSTFPGGYVISATYAGFTRNSQIDVVAVTALRLAPTSVARGATSTATVEIAPQAMTASVVVSLASSSPDVTVPANVTLPLNAQTATFQVATSATAAPGPYTITATLPGSSKRATLTIMSD
ncbi:MAG: hypothetical protein WB493_05435 [Anaeromyxobacteraceae bacterium]